MSDNIDFKKGADTGEVDEESISPIKFAEPAVPASFNRPVEALRNRTEVLRVEANESRWVRDADRASTVWLEEGGKITWEGTSTGRLSLSGGSLYIASLLGPGASRDSAYEFSGAKFPSRRAHAYLAFSDGVVLRVRSNRLQVEGGNEISIEFKESGELSDGHLITVTGTPDVDSAVQPGRDNILVWLGYNSASTYNAIISDLMNTSSTASLVTVDLYEGDGSESAKEVEQTYLKGGLDGVYHQVPPSALDPELDLQEGDCLAIWYDSVKLRRESVEHLGDNHILESSNLVNLSKSPEKAANALPVGRVLNGRFVWFDGTVLEPGKELERLDYVLATQVVFDDSSVSHIEGDDIQALLEDADAKFSTLQGEVDGHESTLNAHATTLGEHETRLDGHDTTLATHEDVHDDFQEQVDVRLRTFETLQSLNSSLDVGEAGILVTGNVPRRFGDVDWQENQAGYPVDAMATDGQYTYIFDKAGAAYSLHNAVGERVVTYNVGVSGANKFVVTNGEYVAFGAGHEVEIFSVEGEQPLGGYAQTVQLELDSLAMSEEFLFTLHDELSGLYRVSLDDFSVRETGSPAPVDNTHAVCTGDHVFITGGVAGGETYLARYSIADNAYDLQQFTFGSGSSVTDFVSDGAYLYVAYTGGEVLSLPLVRVGDLKPPEWTLDTGATNPRVYVDHTYIYILDAGGSVLQVYGKKSRHQLHVVDLSGYMDAPFDVVADGEAVFIGSQEALGTPNVTRIHVGHPPTIFTRIGGHFRDHHLFNHAVVPTQGVDRFGLPRDVDFGEVTADTVKANKVTTHNTAKLLANVTSFGNLREGSLGVASVVKSAGDGEYIVHSNLDIPPNNPGSPPDIYPVMVATVNSSGPRFITCEVFPLDNEFRVRTFDANGEPEDTAFSLAVFYQSVE